MKPSTPSSPTPRRSILNAFYGRVYSQVMTDTSLTYYFNGQAGKRRMQLANVRRSRALGQLKPERLVQPKIRKAFPDTAYWVADIQHRRNGQATVHFDYPDAITSWRATARGVTPIRKRRQRRQQHHRAQEHHGAAGGAALLPPGDEITHLDHRAELSADRESRARLHGAHRPASAGRQRSRHVTVPSGGLMKVDYRVRVLNVDSAKVLGKALTDVESDAMELTLPVVPFGVKLAIAKSGSLAGAGMTDTMQQMQFPQHVEVGTRKLTVNITPSIAGSVFSALASSPRILTDAPSRPCRASCLTCWWPTP